MKKNIIFLLLFFITAFFAFNIKARAAEYQYCEYQLFDDEYNDVENSYHECPAKGLVWMPFLGPVGLVAKEIACLNNYKLLDSSFIGFKLSVVNVSGYALPLIDDTKSASLAYPGINNLSSDKFYEYYRAGFRSGGSRHQHACASIMRMFCSALMSSA